MCGDDAFILFYLHCQYSVYDYLVGIYFVNI